MFHRVKPEAQQSDTQPQNSRPQDSATEKDVDTEEKTENAAETEKVEEGSQESTESTIEDNETEETVTEKTSNQAEEAKMNPARANQVNQEPTATIHKMQESQTQTMPSASPYQRPSYTTSYTPSSSPSYAAPPMPERKSSALGDRRLTIGAGITMSGEIESCDYLLVEGTVEAALKGASTLDISESGTFYGTVEIEEATVAGRFEGEITVTGRLLIRSGGVVTGTISYGALEVEAGAVIDGHLTPVAGVRPAQQRLEAPKVPSAPAAARSIVTPVIKKPVAKDSAAAPANSEDGELFSSKTAS